MKFVNPLRASKMPTPLRRVGIHFSQSSITLSVLAIDQHQLERCITRACRRDESGRILAQWVAEYDLKGLPTYVTLSRNDYETQFVDVPGVGDDELRDALPWRVTPPGVLSNEEIIATGVRLKNDREAGAQEPSLVRATIMSQSLLDQMTEAVRAAGLDLRGVYPRETALITLANQRIDATAETSQADAPPILTAFVAQRSTGIAVSRGSDLYLSRTVTMDVDRDVGVEARQADQLISECSRTATNFNKRLSDTPLASALIGPDAPGMESLSDALGNTLGVETAILGLPGYVTPADAATQATATTPQGMLAVAGTMDAALPANASIYQPPAKDRSMTAPGPLLGLTTAAVLVLVAISGVQTWQLHQGGTALDQATRERDAQQARVNELQQTLENKRQSGPSAELVARRDALQQRYATYEQALTAFETLDTDLTAGFAEPLTALGNARVEPVWLQSVSMDADQVVIRGRTLEPFQAEAFAARLEQAPAFKDWSAETVDINNRTEAAGGLVVHDFLISGAGSVAKPSASRETESTPDNNDLRRLLRRDG